MIPDSTLEGLERLLAEGPPRPVKVEGCGGIEMDGIRDSYRTFGADEVPIAVYMPHQRAGQKQHKSNAQLDAALRNAAPDLIAEIRRLRAMEERVKAARDEMRQIAGAHIAVCDGSDVAHMAAGDAYYLAADMIDNAMEEGIAHEED